MTATVDVGIVGAGPVGTTLAVLLGQLGHDVRVVERWSDPYPLPRAVHMDHEVARIFQSAGLEDALEANTESAPVYEWRNAAGTTLLRFGREEASRSGWAESLMFHQPTLERLLAERAASLPSVRIDRGVEVVGMAADDDGVTLETRVDHDAGRTERTESTVRSRYVVGCDGANSTVRGLAGLPVDDLGFFFDWLIVDVVLHEEREFDPVNVQICDPDRPTTCVSGGPGRRRWEFMRLDGETVDELNTEDWAWALLAPWDVRPDNATLERHVVYTFAAQHAEKWRRGRTLVAGDAAHLMPPFAGQGMCSGIRDAANLAWKLGHVLDGTADESILDTYQQERVPDARQAIEFSMELGKVICISDHAEAAARDEAMAAKVGRGSSPEPSRSGLTAGLIDTTSPHAGLQLPQGTTSGVRLDTALGNGWKLLTRFDPAGVVLDAAEWFDSIGGRIAAVPADDEITAAWFDEHDVVAALQRPDFTLYATAADPAAAGSVLDRLRTHLTRGALTP